MRALLDGGYRSDLLRRISCPDRSPGRQIQREAVGQHQCERIERLRMRVVVIVVRLDMYSGQRVRNSVGEKKMSVNLAGVSVVSIGTGMDVLERRKKESQQKCQACLDSYRATHHLSLLERLPVEVRNLDWARTRLQLEVNTRNRQNVRIGGVILSSMTGQ